MTQYIPHAIFVGMFVCVWSYSVNKSKFVDHWERKRLSEADLRITAERRLEYSNNRVSVLERESKTLRDLLQETVLERDELREKLDKKNSPYR